MQDNDIYFAIILILLFATLGCFLITLTRHHYQTKQEQIKIFLVALGARFVASIAVYEFGLAKVLGDEDSGGFYRGLVLAYQWGKQQVGLFELPGVLAEAYQKHHEGYYYMVGALSHITETSGRLPAAALNCFFGALTVVFTYRIARSLFSQWTATRVGWFCCFFPSLIIWSAQTLKEPVVIFLETVALYACIQLKLSGFSTKYILLCAASVLLLYPFRFYAAFLAAIAAALALIIPRVGQGLSSIKSAIAIGVLVVPLAVSTGMLARSEAEFERLNPEKLQQFRQNVATGSNSGVKSDYDMRTSSGFVVGTAIGAAHLLLAPFPWQLGGGSLRMALTLPELVFWWWLVFVGLGTGIWYAVRTRLGESLPLFIFIVGLGLLYSMMFGNVGLIFRQRAQLLPWLLVFAVAGLEQRAIKKLLKSRPQLAANVLAQARHS